MSKYTVRYIFRGQMFRAHVKAANVRGAVGAYRQRCLGLPVSVEDTAGTITPVDTGMRKLAGLAVEIA